MSCLLPPKSSTRAALPPGVRAGLSSVSSTTTLLSLVASAAGVAVGAGSVPWAKAVTEKPPISTRQVQRAARVLQIFLFFMGHILLFGISGNRRPAGHHAARQHGVQLGRGHAHSAHHLDDLQVLRLGFLRFQGLQLFLLFRNLLAGLSDFLVNALDFVLSHSQSLHSISLFPSVIAPQTLDGLEMGHCIFFN